VKPWFTLGLAVLLAGTCAAQVHGIPASVNSPRNGSFFSRNGIPASVASLGPLGYSSRNDFVPAGPLRRNRLGRVVMPVAIPLFYEPFPVMYVPVAGQVWVAEREREPRATSEPQKIVIEIRDTRPPASVVKEVAAEEPPAAIRQERREEIELPRVATVFIFRDGTRKDLKDFAITATELIDLSEGLIRRSPLDALDRAATLKANAEQGVELHFPAAASD
jgi:hypothetical protein